VSHGIIQDQKEAINHADEKITNTAIEANGAENKRKVIRRREKLNPTSDTQNIHY
jgi:hypothetical protein